MVGRRRGPVGKRWTNPSSPVQAARFEQRWSQDQVAEMIRNACPGHGASGRPCLVRPEKLSDWERLDKRPTRVHIEVLCGVYGKSAEALGLISWRAVEGVAFERVVGEPADGARPVGGDLRARVEGEVRAQIERELRLLIERDFRVALQEEVYAAVGKVLLGVADLGEASDDDRLPRTC